MDSPGLPPGRALISASAVPHCGQNIAENVICGTPVASGGSDFYQQLPAGRTESLKIPKTACDETDRSVLEPRATLAALLYIWSYHSVVLMRKTVKGFLDRRLLN